jgi:hypothetical protein
VGRGVSARRKRQPASKPINTRVKPRSLALTDADWAQIDQFGVRRGLVSRSDAARLLLRSGLYTEAVIDEIAAAHEWQIAQAWQTALASYSGKERMGSWSRVEQAIHRARMRAHERERAATG